MGSISRHPASTDHKLSLPDVIAQHDVTESLSPPATTKLRSSFHGLSSPRVEAVVDEHARADSDVTSDGEAVGVCFRPVRVSPPTPHSLHFTRVFKRRFCRFAFSNIPSFSLSLLLFIPDT